MSVSQYRKKYLLYIFTPSNLLEKQLQLFYWIICIYNDNDAGNLFAN